MIGEIVPFGEIGGRTPTLCGSASDRHLARRTYANAFLVFAESDSDLLAFFHRVLSPVV